MADNINTVVTFAENPTRFCQQIYAEALKRSETLRPIDEENRLFYEGIDKRLEERRNDPLVERSALHIPEVAPAIDSRVGEAVSKINETATPVVCQGKAENLTKRDKENIAYTQRTITQQLRDCGYLTDIWEEHMRAAEIYRSPSVVKVGWENKRDTVIGVEEPSIIEMAIAAMRGREVKPKISYSYRSVGRPYVDWLSRDQFLYEPNRSDFDRTMTYKLHPDWYTYEALVAMAGDQKWDIDLIKKYKDEAQTASSASAADKIHRENIEAEKETGFEVGFKEGKCLVVENYIITYDDNGNEVFNLAVMLGNKYLIFNKTSPFRLMRDPFVELLSHRLPGTTENFSSMDRGKHMQRVNDEAYNSYLDHLTYKSFPPMVAPYGMTWKGHPVWGAGRIWYVSEPELLRPLIENSGSLPDLPNLIAAISAKIRHILNAEDLSQGFQAQEYEKATATMLRAKGAARTSTPRHKRYGEAIIRVAEKFLALNRQFHEDADRFATDIFIDVPSLTAVTSPDQEKQESFMLLQSMTQDPIYNLPSGMRKRRALWEDIVRSIKKTNTADFFVTEEEFDVEMKAQNAVQEAMLEKQQAVENLTIAQSSAPQPQEQ